MSNQPIRAHPSPSGRQEPETIRWDEPYTISVRVYNLGHDSAPGTQVKLYYAEPNTASSEWAKCRHNEGGSLGAELVQTVDLGEFDARNVEFIMSWIPNQALDELSAELGIDL